MALGGSKSAERTLDCHVDLIIDFLYSDIDALYLLAEDLDPALDTECEFQNLRSRHPGLLLRQSVQPA